MNTRERRQRRSNDPLEALRLQLEACRLGWRSEAVLLADADGLCVASAGPAPVDELAAEVAGIGRKVASFEGVLMAPPQGYPVTLRRFEAAGATLLLCAVGGGDDGGPTLADAIGGVTRILAA